MAKYTLPVQLPPDAHILVVKLAAIGDLLLATPALRALRESYPQAQIDLLVTPSSAGILDAWEVINRVIVLDKYLFDHPKQLLTHPGNLLKLLPLLRALRGGHYDAVLLMHHLTLFFGRRKHQALMLATGAKYRVGLDNGHGWFLNVRVRDEGFGHMHEAEYNLAVAEAVGGKTGQKELTMPLTEAHRQEARRLVSGTLPSESAASSPEDRGSSGQLSLLHKGQNSSALATPAGNSETNLEPATWPDDGSLRAHQAFSSQEERSPQESNTAGLEWSARPIIAMHPGSGGYSTARRWSPERFAQLADTLYRDAGSQMLLIGGPEEAELHQRIMGMLRSGVPVRSLAGKSTIQVTAAVLELADLFIGNDAGPMHLAAAVGTPVVAIFGLSNSDAWGPYTGQRADRKAIVVKQDLPCMPCFYRGHDLGLPEGCATRDCLATLGVDPVAVAARRLLRETGKIRV